MQDERLTPVGFITTPYKEKFGIPRQPGLVTHARGCITFVDECNDINLLRGIEQFTHLWLVFRFHQTEEQGWSPLVRPPRLGGNEKMGVFATRSTFRPNPIGMSVVRFDEVCQKDGQVSLYVTGMDLMDGTPILDIKPYIPYSDSLTDATGGFAETAPPISMSTQFSPEAEKCLSQVPTRWQLKSLIVDVLNQDPRPAYKRSDNDDRIYGVRLFDANVRWQVKENVNWVTDISLISDK